MARTVETGIVITASAKSMKKGVKAAGKSLKGLRVGLKKTGDGVKKFGAGYQAGMDTLLKSVQVFGGIGRMLSDTVRQFLDASAKFRFAGDDQLRSISRFKREADRTMGAFGEIFTAMFAGLADSVTPVIKGLRSYLKVNREIVGVKVVESLAATAQTLLGVLGPAVNFAYRVFSGFKMIVSLTTAGLSALESGVIQLENAFRAVKIGSLSREIKAQKTEMKGLFDAYIRVRKAQGEESGRAKQLKKEWGDVAVARDKNIKKLKDLIAVDKIRGKAAKDAAKASSKATAKASREILQQKKDMEDLEELIKKISKGLEGGIAAAAAAMMKRLREEVKSSAATEDEREAARAKAAARKAAAAKIAAAAAQKAGDAERRRLEEQKALQAQIGSAIGSGVGGAIKDVIQGTKSASDAMKDFAIQVSQAIVKAAILSAIQSAVSVGTMGAGSGGLVSGLASSLLSFNSGGYVPGFASGGGVDSVNARLTPGEFVLPKGLVDSIRLGKAPPRAAYANGGMVAAGASNGPSSVNVQMQTFAVPSRGEFRRWYKSSVAPNVRSMGKRGQL